MPTITLNISPQGHLLEVFLDISQARRNTLTQAGVIIPKPIQVTSLPHRERNKRDCHTEFIQNFEVSRVYIPMILENACFPVGWALPTIVIIAVNWWVIPTLRDLAQ